MSGRVMILTGVTVLALLGGAAGVAGLLRAGDDRAGEHATEVGGTGTDSTGSGGTAGHGTGVSGTTGTGIDETTRPVPAGRGAEEHPAGPEAEEYWTPERMRRAAPAPMPEGREP